MFEDFEDAFKKLPEEDFYSLLAAIPRWKSIECEEVLVSFETKQQVPGT